jgi:hypothetical protein
LSKGCRDHPDAPSLPGYGYLTVKDRAAPLIYPTKARTTATQKKTPIPTKQSAAIRSLQLDCLRRPVSAAAVSFLRLGIRVAERDWDHVFPISWYPDTTPPDLEKWKIPSCLPAATSTTARSRSRSSPTPSFRARIAGSVSRAVTRRRDFGPGARSHCPVHAM